MVNDAAQNGRSVIAGRKVLVTMDGDGAAGKTGVIEEVYPSGRCRVRFDADRSFRSILPENIEVIE